MLADYHIIRRRKLKVNDLYCGDSSSIYWYHGGFNWRAPVAFIMGAWPMLRKFLLKKPQVYTESLECFLTVIIAGLVASVNASTDASWVGWIRLYNLTFIIGLAIAFAVFLGLNLAIPPPGLGEEGEFEPINHSRAPSSDGAGDARFGSQDGQHEKTAPVYVV